MSKKLAIWLGVFAGLIGTVIIAVLAIAVYAIYQHVQVDHQNLHALTAIAQYNLQEGKILPLPQAPPVPGTPPQGPPVPHAAAPPTDQKK